MDARRGERVGSSPGGADAAAGAPGGDFSALFEALPLGAYRSRPDGTMVRANAALVRLNGCDSEAELLARVRDIANEWYVDPQRRAQFKRQLEAEGRLSGFEAEVIGYKDRRRIWVRESAVLVRGEDGRPLYYEGTVEEITDGVLSAQALQRSEQRLQQLVSLIPGVVFRLALRPDGTRRYSFCSDHVRTLYGLEPQEVLADGDALARLRHPDDAARVNRLTEVAMREGRDLHYEARVLLRDGTEKWIQVFSSPAPPEDGDAVRVGVLFDVTERRRTEDALHQQAERWKAAFEASGDGVWDWQVQDGIETLSAQCEAMYGFSPGELPNSPDALDERTHPDDLARMTKDREAHFAGLTPRYVNEHRVRHKDGRWLWVLSRGMVIERDTAGRPLRMVGTHTDITANKHADALRAERDRAAAADLAKSQFLSRVSHELRTPLNAILGFAQLLELDPGPGHNDRQRGWVQQVLGSGRHLLALMDDILQLSSAQTGQLSITSESLLLRPVVDEVLAMLSAEATDAGVSLHVDWPAEHAQLAVCADRKRLKQIVSNLLSNAIKYNRRGGWVRLSANSHRGDGLVEFNVADSGIGLNDAQRLRLFQPFERLGAQRGPIAGTGLGLALSRQLAEAMGGSVDVLASAPGEGSVFSLRLPAG
jgi:PAS domain S-box-containing protein